MNIDDLKQFCTCTNDCRDFLRQPFSDAKYTYATNGHIMVRVPRILEAAEDNFAEKARELFEKTAPAKQWFMFQKLLCLQMLSATSATGLASLMSTTANGAITPAELKN